MPSTTSKQVRTTSGPLIPYMRKSSGEDPAGSLARQRGAIERWAEANGVELAPEVWEPNVSGKRPWQERGLGEALARVQSGEASGIVCEEQSRLSRESLRATAEVWEAFERAGARLVCTAEGLDTDKGDHELSFAIRAALAREQWKQYARRMDDVKTRKVRAGIMVGRTPVGYIKNTDKTLSVDPVLAPAIKGLYERRVAGSGWTTLARFLEEETGRHWSEEGIRSIIRRRLYVEGRLRYGDIVSDVECGALIPTDLWHAAQRSGEDLRVSRDPRADSVVEWLCTGLLRCTCGFNLSPSSTNSGRKDKTARRYYRCVDRRCTSRASVRAEKIEAWIVRETLDQGDDLEARATAPDLSTLEDALEEAERRLSQVMADGVADDLGDLWAPEVRKRREARDECARRLGEARAAAGVTPVRFDLRSVWDDLSLVEKKQTLRAFWRSVVVGKKFKRGGDEVTPLTLTTAPYGFVVQVDALLDEVER